jgi:hypothetical protein
MQEISNKAVKTELEIYMAIRRFIANLVNKDDEGKVALGEIEGPLIRRAQL